MSYNHETPWGIQTSDPSAPSVGVILYPYDDASSSGKQWRTRDSSEINIVLLKHNYAATAAPTTGDDVGDGYAIGSIWVDTTNGNAYICEDNSTGAAQWLQINGAGGGGSMTSFDLAADTGTAETVEDSETVTMTGGDGIDTSVAATNNVTVAVDSSVVRLTATQTLTNKTLTTPTIGDFTNATHDHSNNANGGTLPAASIGSGVLAHERGGLEVDVSAYAGLAIIEGGSTTELKINRTATAAPTTSNDNTEGYSIGSLWFDVTNDLAYACLDASTGAAVWNQIDASGGSGAVTVIDSDELAMDAASISITSIAATYQDLLLIVKGRKDTNATGNLELTFNSDTGNSYADNYSTADQTGTEAHSAAHNQTAATIANCLVGNNGDANHFGQADILIAGYSNSAFTRGGTYKCHSFQAATALVRAEGTIAWKNVAAAISSIQLASNSGNFKAGTQWILYGLGTAI